MSRLRHVFLDEWRPYAWIIAAGLALYFKTLTFGFCFFDDYDLILTKGPFLSDISNVIYAFGQTVYPDSITVPYYRPLLIVSFILNAQVGGLAPMAYHLTNIAIHLAVGCLVFALFLRLGFAAARSLAFALIFTVHPVLSQAVAWVPGRNDSMLAAFGIASFIAFLKYSDGGSRRAFLWHLIFLLLAIFTKESAIVVAVVCYIYMAVVRGRSTIGRFWVPLAAGHAVVLGIWFTARTFVTRGSDPTTLFDIYNLVIPQIPAVAQLVGKALFPVNQSVFPTMRESSSLYGIAAVSVIAVLVALCRGASRRMAVFGLIWLGAFLVPPLVRSHAPVIDDVLEHRLYMPMIGLMMIFMSALQAKRWPANRRAVPALIAAFAILALFCKSFFYIDRFRDPVVFWEDAVKASPHSAFARLKLGEVYYRYDRIDDALAQIRYAMKMNFFTTYAGYYYLGHIYLKKGDMVSAEREFRKTLALMPDNDWAAMSLGVICYRTGRGAEAEELWRRSLAINPDNAESAKNLALYYTERKDPRSARRYFSLLRNMGIEPPADIVESLGAE